MRWRAELLVAVTVLGLGWSVVERVRYLRLKTAPPAEHLPADRKPTAAEQAAWNRAIRERLRSMSALRGRADLALLVGLGPGLMALLVVLYRSKDQTPNRTLEQSDEK